MPIDDLMEVSRITRGKIELQASPVALDRGVLDAVEVSKPLFVAAEQELVLDLHCAPCHVHGDAVRLTQVFANLLNNASKYTPPSGRIVVTMLSDAKTVQVQITYTGIGIPPHPTWWTPYSTCSSRSVAHPAPPRAVWASASRWCAA
jgi:signal transduction histidine kinase